MRYFEELLCLSYMKGTGRAAVNRYAAWRAEHLEYSDARHALREWMSAAGYHADRAGLQEAREKTGRTMEWLAGYRETRVITVMDSEFPAALGVMGGRRPPFLFVTGKWPAAGNNSGVLTGTGPRIAVIGARWPSAYTLERGHAFAKQLADACPDALIISGLARGCDRMGHGAAIEAGLPTVAVMPCGPDIIVPEVNRDLAEDIKSGAGLLVTEYPPYTPLADYRYTERDRIVAALAEAAVVIECEKESGTMQTVKAAKEYGRMTACWYPHDARKYGFEGNQYMSDIFDSMKIADNHDLENFAGKLEKIHKSQGSGPLQLSFL